MARLLLLSALILAMIGCDTSDRITRLEKQNQELQAEVKKGRATADFDLQAKCSKEAREWFRENFRYEKTTIFLTYNGHYNKEKNGCFVVVEDHMKTDFGEEGSWSNVIELWDVLENNRYASLQVDHIVHFKPEFKAGDSVARCEVAGKECKSLEEFNTATRPYMAN